MTLPYAFVLNHISGASAGNKQLNLSALAVVRSLSRQKIPVVLVTTNKTDAFIDSRHCPHVESCPCLFDNESALVDFLNAPAEKYAGPRVLVPDRKSTRL